MRQPWVFSTWHANERTGRGHAEVAKAMDHMLTRWDMFSRFLGDGRNCLSTNAAERALRGIALGRKAWLFCGSRSRPALEGPQERTSSRKMVNAISEPNTTRKSHPAQAAAPQFNVASECREPASSTRDPTNSMMPPAHIVIPETNRGE